MKKLLLTVLIAGALSAAAVAYYINAIDWNEHKTELATEFKELTGKEIVFGGPVVFKIFPRPYLQASGVKIYNGEKGGKPLVEVPSLVAHLALAPLLKGQFEVERMTLQKPLINIELLADGRLNWQSQLSPEQRHNLETAQIAFNSASIQDATVTFEDLQRDYLLELENLNGEIVAQSLLGPYRIEGNYVKDNNPEGFALSVGKLSDSFATTLNLGITHPTSESYVRFDGSFMLSNKVLNGNLIVEIQKLRQFFEANVKSVSFVDDYDYPLAITTDISLNEHQLGLENIVLKYGETQGAGNMSLPFNDGFDGKGVRPRLETAFNFTDLDLTPFKAALDGFVKTYGKEGTEYNPDLSFDVLADVKSVRTIYNGQNIKDFDLSFDIMQNILTVNNLNATVPGDTRIKVSGMVSPLDGEPFYSFDTSLKTVDLLQTLKWLNIDPEAGAASTYRKAEAEAKLLGTPSRLQISPFALTVDKSSISGSAGIKFGSRPDVSLTVATDMINFDNYVPQLSDEQKGDNFGQRLGYHFARLGWLNDFDMQLSVKMKVGIYENVPFENVVLDAVLLNNKMDISQLKIGSAANGTFDISGTVWGFGGLPRFENLNYHVATDNASGFFEKMALAVPDWDYNSLRKFDIEGVASGGTEDFVTRFGAKLQDMNINFDGGIKAPDDDFAYDGRFELHHPDFARMIKEMKIDYTPQGQALGLFDLKAAIKGQKRAFGLSEAEGNVGYNTFAGAINYNPEGHPKLQLDLDVNKLEVERFINKKSSAGSMTVQNNNDKAEFLARPVWDKNLIDYDYYTGLDIDGQFDIHDLSYKNHKFTDAQVKAVLADGILRLESFATGYLEGTVAAEGQLQMTDDPRVEGKLKLSNLDLALLPAAGTTYGAKKGALNFEATFDADADSESDIVRSLNAQGAYELTNVVLKGWNLAALQADIENRRSTDGFSALVKNALSSGETTVDAFKGNVAVQAGEAALSDVRADVAGADISASGEVNLPEWTLDVLFKARFDKPEYLPGFEFAYRGSINAPVVDENVEALFDVFKKQEDIQEAETKAAETAAQTQIKNQADNSKTMTEVLLDDIRRKFEPDIEIRRRTAFSNEAVAAYAAVADKIAAITSDLSLNLSRNGIETPSADVLAEIDAVNAKSAGELEVLRKQLDEAYVADMLKSIEAQQKVIRNIFAQFVQEKTRYQEAESRYKDRLAKIVTEFKMEDDPQLKELGSTIEKTFSEQEEQNRKVEDEFKRPVAFGGIAKTERRKNELETLGSRLEKELAQVRHQIDEFSDYAEQKVVGQEEAYASAMRAQEVQRKIEENTGSISIKKNGRVVKVSREIEEIEQAEQLTEDKVIGVLDFSGGTTSKAAPAEKEEPANQVNVVKKSRRRAK